MIFPPIELNLTFPFAVSSSYYIFFFAVFEMRFNLEAQHADTLRAE